MDKINVRVQVPLKGRDRVNRLLQYYNISWNWDLQPKAIDIAAELYYQYLEASKLNKDVDVVMATILSKKNKDKVIAKLGTSSASLANALTTFRKIGLLRNNKLFMAFVPSTILDDKFVFQINFNNGK